MNRLEDLEKELDKLKLELSNSRTTVISHMADKCMYLEEEIKKEKEEPSKEFDGDKYWADIHKSSLYKIMMEWTLDNSGQRFGQYFVNKYITTSWPELFYADQGKSHIMIAKWLVDNQYKYDLPPLRKT